jgi:hypothetical protein
VTFLEKYRQAMWLKHLSYRTQSTYLPVIRPFMEFHGGRTHPRDMGDAQIRACLTHRAVGQNVAVSIQNVALIALLFLYWDMLHIELLAIEQVERAQRPARLAEMFTREEALAVLERMEGTPRLMAHPPAGRRLGHSDCAGTAGPPGRLHHLRAASIAAWTAAISSVRPSPFAPKSRAFSHPSPGTASGAATRRMYAPALAAKK